MITMLLILLAPFLMTRDERSIKGKHADVLAFMKTAKTERDFRAVAGDLSKLAEEAFSINKYELAARLYADAERISRTALKDAALAQQHQESAKKTAEIGKEYAKAAKACDRILRNEGTPEDFTLSGKFLCFVKGDWELGIADLAKGKDDVLQKLAQADLAGGQEANGLTVLGDLWMTRKEPGSKDRAAYWYAKAWPLTSGIVREKLRTKLHAIFFRAGKTLGVPAGWETNSPNNIATDETCVRFGARALLIRPTGFHHYPRIRQPIPAGKTYKVSAWVLTDGADKDFPIVRLLYKEGAGLVGDPITATVDQPWWVRI